MTKRFCDVCGEPATNFSMKPSECLKNFRSDVLDWQVLHSSSGSSSVVDVCQGCLFVLANEFVNQLRKEP